MADWTTIPDTTFEPGAPAKGRDMRFLRDNPIAIAEGAPGAPRIAGQQGPAVRAAGLFSGNAERDWVLARIASAALGAVGTYRIAYYSSSTQRSPGDTVAGSNLRVRPATSVNNFGISIAQGASASTLSGTWRLMGADGIAADNSSVSGPHPAALWLRIS